MSAAAMPRPWAIGRLGGSLWIEGAVGSAASETFPADRRIVCDMKLYGDAELDAETERNATLIVECVNGRES
ncbi:hypothetical protein [Rubrobacter indicoceani]|uniref:hypothetical protein n=1 Tax=Rubrobacter indicoceani TaxID=2051957 RepID=UPI0013C4A892|nr:hypothetical protein [Rubrobacter indicoceani]